MSKYPKNIAVLITSFNRKEKTLKCLRSLYSAKNTSQHEFDLSLYLTDDGSTDGTSDAIKNEFSNDKLVILNGTGSLFWAGGMRNSWNEALKGVYDGYLLLNDDTNLTLDLFDELFKIHEFSLNKYKKVGIYCGITRDENNKTTYGGSVLINRFLYTSKLLDPNGKFQECDLGNANIMYVPREVVNLIGIFNKHYIHGAADYDYTLRAIKNNIPVLISSKYIGFCMYDHEDPYKQFSNLNLKDRIKYLNNPLTLAFNDKLLYMRLHFPQRFVIYLIVGWLKTLFPKTYLFLDKRRKS